jgi:2-dehydro-3-deoxyphosphogluconate aldolase / (4S)-4-hydroxy-2-oxoglutarate aldolase
MANVLTQLRESKIVPVIVIEDPEAAVPLARALVEGGLPVAEVTFRTDAGVEALRRITEAYPGMLAGAGTVLSVEQVARAEEAGAHFVVSPGFNPAVVDACQERGIPVYPGVCTPTEIEMALAKGLEVVKFFPAEPIGGLAYLKAIAAPYGMMQFMPTGGITPTLLGDYLRFPKVVACGGSWMVAPDWIRNQDFDRIRQEAERAVASVRDLTGGR